MAEAAKIAIRECSRPEFADLDIRFYLYGKDIYQSWQQALDEFHKE